MQQIPAMKLPEDRQNDYRNCFIPDKEDWVIVGSDLISQELAIIQALSQDPVFYEALKTGKDLHSVCAELIYKDVWKNAADEGCEFYKLDENGNPKKGKCNCKGHKKLRSGVKTLNFGLAYGMSEIALSADLNISVEEAKKLMNDYFSAFPKIKGVLDAFGYYGELHGFIRTPKPLRRKRYFPYWSGPNTKGYLLGKINRASKNMPIQGLAADMVKIAMCLLRRRFKELGLRDLCHPFMQVHDQIDYECHKDVAELVAKEVTYWMEIAAKICLGNDLLKTDTNISEKWQK